MYTKIEFQPKKKVAKGFLCYVPTVLFLLMLGLFVAFLINLFKKDFFISFICGCLVGVLYLIVYIMSFTLDWFLSGTLTYYKDKGLLEYIEKGVLEIGSSKSTYKMKEITKVKKHKESIWLYGPIDAVEGIHKTKLKKLELKTYGKTEEVYNLIEDFMNNTKNES